MKSNNKYTQMQQAQYDTEASKWTTQDRDHVVGSFDKHNQWSDYDIYLFKDLDTKDMVALDFGCGPGRNIVRFANRFKQIDGADISQINLDNAQKWIEHNNVKINHQLYKNNGVDLSAIDADKYDVVYSTICMQHICVHEIRFSLLSEFFRVLKSGGHICIQMGFGPNPTRKTADYFENYYDAQGTNSRYDVRIDDPTQVETDLAKIGFKDFRFDIRPMGPGDGHANWIFFRATKQ